MKILVLVTLPRFLDLSAQKDNDEVRIIKQLIDAKNDKLIWAIDGLEDKYGLK